MAHQRPAPPDRSEECGMAHLRCGDVERAHLPLELLGIVDQREQIGEGNELAVVEPPADEARVVVAPLLAVADGVDAGPELSVDGQAHGVVAGRRELGLAQSPFQVFVDRLQHPARSRPAADTHHRQRADRGSRRRRRQNRRDRDGDGLTGDGSERRRAHAPRRLALGERALADEEASLLAASHERDKLVAVIRHHAGKSSSTEISVERNSRSWPRFSGSMC